MVSGYLEIVAFSGALALADISEMEMLCNIVGEQSGQNIEFIEHSCMFFDSEAENGKYFIVYSWETGIELNSELDIKGRS